LKGSGLWLYEERLGGKPSTGEKGKREGDIRGPIFKKDQFEQSGLEGGLNAAKPRTGGGLGL